MLDPFFFFGSILWSKRAYTCAMSECQCNVTRFNRNPHAVHTSWVVLNDL